MDNKIFISALIKIIEKSGELTQTELAKLTGFSQSTISGYINKKTNPRLKYKKGILLALETSLGYSEADIEKIGVKEIEKRTFTFETEKVLNVLRETAKKQEEEKKIDNLDLKRIEKLRRHYSIVEEYKDQETAISINQKLVEIEKLDREVFRDIESELQTKIDNIKRRLPKSVSGEAINGTVN